MVSAVKLQNAFLCVDCEVITAEASGGCPSCGGQALLSLARVLGTISPDTAAQVVEVKRDRWLQLVACGRNQERNSHGSR